MSHDIFFDPEEHIYLVDGQEVVSTTTVLNYLSDMEYKKVNPVILEQAAKRGTAIHEYCELIDYDAMPEYIEGDLVGYIQAYLSFIRDYSPMWEQVETTVYCESKGYIGTLDRAGLIDGKQTIVDIKTLASPTKMNKFTVSIQTAAYALARRETVGTETEKRYALYLGKDGDYNLMDCGLYEIKYGIDSMAIFDQCLSLYKQVQELKDAKPISRKGKG